MKSRCLNPKHKAYKDYGQRGIGVSTEFLDAKFFCKWALDNGYVEGLQLDRRDNSKGYCKENCRFVTGLVNQNNQRPRKKKSSLPTGVLLSGKKFRTRITMYGKNVCLGTWNTPEEASKQYQCIKRIYIASLESR